MPKTTDAFAFRRLANEIAWATCDGCRYGYLPTYEGRNGDENDYINSSDCRVEEILDNYLDGGGIKYERHETDFEWAKKHIPLAKARILNGRAVSARLDRHITRLQKYEQKLLSAIVNSEQDTGHFNLYLRDKRGKTTELIKNYEWLLQLFLSYEDVLKQDWKKANDNFNNLCRKIFGTRLRQARIKKNLEMKDVAKQLGLTRAGYGFYELGLRDLPTSTIYRLAEILDVSTDWLFGLKN